MSRQLNDLLLRRGRLIERIAGQRKALRRDFAPVAAALGKVDFAAASVRSGIDYLRCHALITSLIAGGILIFKGKLVLRWGKRAFSLWKSWHSLRGAFVSLGRHFHP